MENSAKITDAVIAEINRQHMDDLRELAKVHKITQNGRARWMRKDLEDKERMLRGSEHWIGRAREKIVDIYAVLMATLMVLGLYRYEGAGDEDRDCID